MELISTHETVVLLCGDNHGAFTRRARTTINRRKNGTLILQQHKHILRRSVDGSHLTHHQYALLGEGGNTLLVPEARPVDLEVEGEDIAVNFFAVGALRLQEKHRKRVPQ